MEFETLQSTTRQLVVGFLVWVEDLDEAWVDGEVAEINGEEVTIDCSSGKTITANASQVYPRDADLPSGGVEDMTRLAYLHEPGVLYNLRCRYDMNEIYTYTGNILIAVNPFRKLPHLYDADVMGRYKGAPFGELSPHPFAIADSAYRQMIDEGISQSILVSGESGAGKTESTKMLMQYLAYMGGRKAAEGRSVEQKVLESNPVLEAFGNAKTLRNNNSSRFGKFVELQFDERGRISGAAIRTYLLERSRVCQVSDPERNYHCFYMLCAAPEEDVKKYKLGNPRTFHYLNQSGCYELDGVNDSNEYLATRKAMDVVGISSDEQDAIFRVVSAILHLGNVEFVKGEESDSSEPKDDQSRFHLKTAAELFMCDEKALEDSLCKRVIVTRDESITKSLDPESAAVNRDALAKIVYSRLFDWLVNKINNSIGQDPDSKFIIGVLDIYGFESFKTNSFEQFCINLTNEKLQQHFNQHVFKMEQEEYTKEEIDWSYIEFIDNKDVLRLVEKKPGGILALLDEACMFPRSTHETFAQKLYQTFKDHKRFSKPKLSQTDFTISHYAGEVTYQTEFFLDKNKDYVVAEHQALLSASECPFVSSLFPPLPEESSKSSKFSSIGARFKVCIFVGSSSFFFTLIRVLVIYVLFTQQQLQALLETLNATEPHYIRCVKPNNALKPAIFENSNVLQQLRCGGVMEAIRISCAGYPTRKTFAEFIARFSILAPEVLHGSGDEVNASKHLLEKANLTGYQIGKTKVFLRAGQMAELDAFRTEVLGRSARMIQRRVRSYLCRKKFLLLRDSAIQIQVFIRVQVANQRYEYLRKENACVRIQKHSRMFISRRAFKELCLSAVQIQTAIRGIAARREFNLRKERRSAIIIQSHCRRYLARLHYKKLKKAAVVIQCAWRRRVARRELRMRKMAAKEAGALQAAKTKLEEEVEDLTRRLQLEQRMRDELEETKAQENRKLQSALENMEREFQEAKDSLTKELEAAKRAAQGAPVMQEVLVSDSEAINKLAAENESLKAMVSSLEQKIDETERRYEEANKLSEERLKQAMEAESKIIELKTTMQRLEEKLSDMELEDQLRRQASSKKTTKNMSARLSIPRQRESIDALLKCVTEDLGFINGKPVAAFTIYKCLVHWKSFESERTSVFDRVIQIIGSAIENQEANDHMAYWLSNSTALLFLLEKSLKTTTATSSSPSKKPPVPTSFFGRMAQSFRSSPSSANLTSVVVQVDAKYPALLFKEQLTAYMEKIFGIIRDNVKKDLATPLASCIQAPKASKSGILDCTESLGKNPASNHWQNITERLNALLETLKDNNVPSILSQKIFSQIFCYINVQLFNRECCSFSNGEYIKSGLDELELWCSQATEEYAGSSWDELKHLRQSVGFLVIHQKSRITYDDLTSDLCPILGVQQLHRICTLYSDDNFNTTSVSSDVISSMSAQVAEDSSNENSNSFLLDDNPSIPFSVEDITSSLDERDFAKVKPPEELLQNPNFQFLHE
ncbi:hypothetical protein QQ045_032244 [Rhodiola kirilowii]